MHAGGSLNIPKPTNEPNSINNVRRMIPFFFIINPIDPFFHH